VPDDAAAYLLLLLDLLVVALVLTLPVLAVWWLIGRPPEPRRAVTRDGAAGTHPSPGERVLRRCDGCGVGWKGRPGDDASVLVLKVRRWKRRSTRGKKQDTPAWAGRRGWSRCPSCLSTDVRTSSRHRTSG
jgi:hypothetical protein